MDQHALLIDITRCTGCGRCVAACPGRSITLEVSGFRKHAALKAPLACTMCGKCLPACPVMALTRPPGDKSHLSVEDPD